MPSPQREDGHLDVANELAEAFARASLNGTQFRLVWVILRKTYGWNKKMDTIGLLQFCEATGLPKKLVSRELNRLARRFIVTAWGDDHHAKQYGIQKDYSRWLDDDPSEVSTNQGTPAAKVSTKTSQSVPQSVDEVSTKQGTTNTRNTTRQIPGTDAHASGSLRDRIEGQYRLARSEGRNPMPVLGELFSILFNAPPNFGRLGSMSKRLNSGGRMIRVMFQAAAQPITDDPHDYLEKVVQRELRGDRRGGTAEPVVLDNGQHISADAARKLAQVANLKLGG